MWKTCKMWQFDKWNNNSAQKFWKCAKQIEKLQWKQCFAAWFAACLQSSSGTKASFQVVGLLILYATRFLNFILPVIFAGVSLVNFYTPWYARFFCSHFSFDFFVHIAALPSAMHCWHCCDFRVSAFPQNVGIAIFCHFSLPFCFGFFIFGNSHCYFCGFCSENIKQFYCTVENIAQCDMSRMIW